MNGEPFSEPSSKLSDADKEQIKLTAAYFNGIAIGLALVGRLTIPSSIALNATTPFERLLAAALSLSSLGVSPYIYINARRWLGRLDR